jgi:hypothetical protein
MSEQNQPTEAENLKTGEPSQPAEPTADIAAPEAKPAAPAAAPTLLSDDAGREPDKAPEAAPESYDFKTPEGTSLDDVVMSGFKDVAKELNLTQASAQKLIDKVAPLMAQRQEEQIGAIRDEWADQVRADKEIGGDKLPEALSIAKKGLAAYGDAEIRDLLEATGLGSHPAVIKHFHRLGKLVKEDTFVGGAAGGESKDMASRMYPNETKGDKT